MQSKITKELTAENAKEQLQLRANSIPIIRMISDIGKHRGWSEEVQLSLLACHLSDLLEKAQADLRHLIEHSPNASKPFIVKREEALAIAP